MSILEDLTALSARKLDKRLEQLSTEALRCIDAWAAAADRTEGLTVALHVDARGRPDVEDLARVLHEEPRCLLASAWAAIEPSRKHNYWRLLLRVDFERPVSCEFVVRCDVSSHPSDPMRAKLPLLLAASSFLLVTNEYADPSDPHVWFAATPARDCLVALVSAVG